MPINIPLARGDWQRGVAKEAKILLKNRYFESNPVLTQDQAALLARMGMRRWLYVGDGPIRAVYSQPGSFDDALFVVSASSVFRVDRDGTKTVLFTGLMSSQLKSVSMAATGNVGTTPEYLFIADGRGLYCYIADGYASGKLTGAPANGDTVQLGSVYYEFTNGDVDAGAPAGTEAAPWFVALGASATEALLNLKDAINADGLDGTQYSTNLVVENAEAQGFSSSADTLVAHARSFGVAGNSVATTETGGLAWAGATLTGGGDAQFFQVPTPDDVGMVSVGYIASHVICVPAQGQGMNGRFYWIDPGETTIDPLNFATAERAPDPVYEVVVFGDQFWLPGETTTEVWYFTGDPDAPVLRLQGVTFDRGTWEGTAIQIKESMIIVDNDGGVFQISGGLQRISNPSIEQRIREAIQYQAATGS